jgi:hypothetical protein
MGSWSKGWADGITRQLEETYESYPALAWRPFKDAFEFVEINYNALFDELRAQWKTEAEKVVGKIPAGQIGAGAMSSLLKIAQEPSRDAFLATHVLDVVLYRFVSVVHEAIKAEVQKQILDGIFTNGGTVKGSWSIIAHSLGTSVTHDVLHGMYFQTLEYKGHPWNLAGITRPVLVAMIANVGRLLETDADVYESLVRPSLDPFGGCCQIFLNARHDFDPFTMPKAFAPTDDWPSLAARQQGRVQLVRINAIEQKNVHALEHYLKNPQLHVAVLRALTWPEAISDAVLKERSAAYELSTPLSKFDGLLKQLKKVKLGENSSWKEVIEGFRDAADIFGDRT